MMKAQEQPSVPYVLRRQLRESYAMDPVNSLHGPSHWGRVLTNGRWIAMTNGANMRVVEAFAFIHDSKRKDDDEDPQHGDRAAEWARELVAYGRLKLTVCELHLLCDACVGHSTGARTSNATIGACWDADRLDLGRVGITPHPRYMSTELGQQPKFIAWATRRATTRRPR